MEEEEEEEEAELQWRHFSMNITFGHFPSLLLLATHTHEERAEESGASGAEVSQELISSLTRVKGRKERTNGGARIQGDTYAR